MWAAVEGEIALETVLVITHTDGGNAVEENGAIRVLDLIRTATERRPKRTLVFVFITGICAVRSGIKPRQSGSTRTPSGGREKRRDIGGQ